LVRVDGIGDALACAPLVAALRDAGHELGALFSGRNRDAFAARAFARVHTVERIAWPRHGMTAESHARALAEVREAEYEVALIASEEPDAYAFAKAASIGQRIGFFNGWEKPLKTLQTHRLLTRALYRPASAARAAEHEVETLFRLGEGLHREDGPTRDVGRLRPLILDSEPRPHGAVALQLNAKFVGAGLDIAAFAAIARELERRKFPTIATGDDDDFGAAFATRAGTSYVHPPTLAEWKGLLAGALAVVTPDSGAAHVAGMLGVPCIVLFPRGSTAARDVMRWRPWAAPSCAIVVDDPKQVPSRVAAALAPLLAGDEDAPR
jgi:ADP-heptose:LPS heptosyltransferase